MRGLQHQFDGGGEGGSRVLLNRTKNFEYTSLTSVLSLSKNKVGKGIKSFHIQYLWMLTGFSAKSDKVCGWETFQILN